MSNMAFVFVVTFIFFKLFIFTYKYFPPYNYTDISAIPSKTFFVKYAAAFVFFSSYATLTFS